VLEETIRWRSLHDSRAPRDEGAPASGRAPTWSLRALRLLVGHACEQTPEAVAALLGHPPDAGRCRLLFDAIALALVSVRMRSALDGLLAQLLAREAACYAGRPLGELATLAGGDPLPPRRALALLWLLGRHPSWAARRVEERLARRLSKHPVSTSPASQQTLLSFL
jgi:hypothetical protein